MNAKLKYRICFLFFLLSISCNSQNRQSKSYDEFPLEVTDDYKKVWFEEFSNNMGTYYFYKLKKPKVIQSIPVTGRFRVNSEGILYGFTLAEDHVFNGTLIPEGSWYNRYSDDDYMITLSKDISIQGFPVYHKETWPFKENNVLFQNDGSLLNFQLAKDIIIDSIPCNGTKKNRAVGLYQDGSLRSCYLSKNFEINGIPCKGGEENSDLWLNHNGQVILCFLSEDFEFHIALH